MKGRSNRQVAKVARKLEKASKAHAQPAKTLKKVAKMKMGGRAVMGTLSPLYGAATGQGLFGEVGEFGLAGQLGKAFRRRTRRARDRAGAGRRCHGLGHTPLFRGVLCSADDGRCAAHSEHQAGAGADRVHHRPRRG